MISIKTRGNFDNAERFLDHVAHRNYMTALEKYGREGVNALASATPVDTGKTANSWTYKVRYSKGLYRIEWLNSNVVNGVPIAVVIQYGHATRNGGYIEGRDFVNPAMRPIFDRITKDAWREVTSI